MIDLNTSISKIYKVGEKTAKKFKKLGIETINDLIFYFPSRYDDLSKIIPIENLKPSETVTIEGKLELISNRRSPVKKKILTEALISDKTGSIKVIWFNQPFLTKILKAGDRVYLAGKVDFDYHGIQIINPFYEKIEKFKNKKDTTHTARIVPVYPTTERLTSKQIRFLIKSVLPSVKQIKDWLPRDIIKKFNFFDLATTLEQIHFPDNNSKLERAIKRLKFEELFLIQLYIQKNKMEFQKSKAMPIKFFKGRTKYFVESLPFKLTDDQRKVSWEILKDLQRSKPMNRLLEGDVGSGKTIVATILMFNIALNNMQVVLMAPTEILAKQHFNKITKFLRDFNFKIALLTRSGKMINDSKISKNRLLEEIKNGDVNIIIGTHALIQEDVEFKSLVLAIIDEQHRFGVRQRKSLKDKSGNGSNVPHLLSMTATPIPRSLALTLYGDLDLSIIRQMPKGRRKIITKIVGQNNRKKAYEFVRKEVKKGRQVFVICPLIDESDKLGVKSVKAEYKKLTADIFPNLKIGLLHGKLKAAEKNKTMSDFLANKINILVSTSVVEVGVDVPNATIMIIEGTDRFGLAQLHQFRGRVGRSELQSYCLLFTDSKSPKTLNRLRALVASNDGFELAEKDLEIRGPGEVYGTKQAGLPDLKIASLTDFYLIKQAQYWAVKILENDLELIKYSELAKRLNKFESFIHLE